MTSISQQSADGQFLPPQVKARMIDRSVVDDWARLAAVAADDKKATNPVILDVAELLAITDAFVITSA